MIAYRFAGEASSLAGECSLEEVVHESRVRSGLGAATATATATATAIATAAAVRRGAWSSGRGCRGCK